MARRSPLPRTTSRRPTSRTPPPCSPTASATGSSTGVSSRETRRPPQLLSTACNDGYGAAGVGMDVITVGDNAFTRPSSGAARGAGRSPTSSRSRRCASRSRCGRGAWANGVNTSTETWDWTRFEGKSTWYSPPCDANLARRPRTHSRRRSLYAHVLVPRVTLEEGFRAQGFREASLGACAVDLDGTGMRGFLTLPGRRATARARRCARCSRATTSLFVEVRDAHPSGASSRWVADDHLEIWLARAARRSRPITAWRSARLSKQWGCASPSRARSSRGTASSSPTALTVERAVAGPGVVRFPRWASRPSKRASPSPTARATGRSSGACSRRARRGRACPSRSARPSRWVALNRAMRKVQGGRPEPVITSKVAPDHPFADDGPVACPVRGLVRPPAVFRSCHFSQRTPDQGEP